MTTSQDEKPTVLRDGAAGEDLAAAVAASLDAADPEEAAAVAAAIGAHLRDREVQAATVAADAEDAGWTGRRWQYADRLGRAAGRSVRVSRDAPADPWTAADRVDRL